MATMQKVQKKNPFLDIPKIELHAHLSGSLSDEVTEKLLSKREDITSKEISILKMGNKRSLIECFEIFRLIKLLTNTIESIKMITYDIINEFDKDNVWYLELRTTPKGVQGAYTKQEYLETVLQTISETEHEMNIMVRLLVSIDREKGVQDGWDTLALTKQYLQHETFGKYLVGIDISGNPEAGNLVQFLPVLREAKKMGLKLAVHLLEVKSTTALDEAQEVIKEGLVDRIGHATFLHPLSGGSKELTEIVKENKIPLEFCLSSNLKVGVTASVDKHHAKVWKEEGHPFAICTDDKGVFSTTLSEEMLLYQKCIDGSISDVQSMILNSLRSSFLQESEKEHLLQRISFFLD